MNTIKEKKFSKTFVLCFYNIGGFVSSTKWLSLILLECRKKLTPYKNRIKLHILVQ